LTIQGVQFVLLRVVSASERNKKFNTEISKR